LKGLDLTNILPIVVRVQLTLASPLDPSLAGAGPVAARRALDELDGLLVIEVDGVDLTGGRAEGPLLPALEGLLGALARLQAGAAAATAELRHGELLLLVRRHGAQARLSLVELGPPARLPVRDLELDLAALTAATLEAAAGLCRALADTPRAGALAARRLRDASRRPRPPPARPGPGPAPRGGAHAPSWPAAAVQAEVELDEDQLEAGAAGADHELAALLLPGRVGLRAGGRALPIDGLPFLTLRDLVAGLSEVARAEQRGDPEAAIRLGRTGGAGRPGRAGPSGDVTLRLDLAAGTLAWDGAPAVQAGPLELGQAARRAVDQLAGLLAAAQPEQPEHPALAELRAAAVAAEAHLGERSLGDLQLGPAPSPAAPPGPAASQAPLAPGELRRMALRVVWQDHVGPPVGPGLAQAGTLLLAVGAEAVVGRCGARRWQAPGADWAALAAGLLVVRRGDRLAALEPGSGRERWSRPLPEAHPTGAAGRRGGALLLGEAGALTAVDPRTGLPRWRLELPGGHGLALAAFGPLLAAGTGSGLLYGVDLEGRVAWRLRAPGPALAPPLLVGRTLASLHAAGTGASLLLVDPGSGRRLGEVPLDVVPAGAPLRWAGGVVLAGRSGGAAVVTLVRLGGGRAWTVEAPLAGTPRLVVAGRALLAADAEGALARLEPSGRLAWSLAAAAAADGAAPVALRGVVVAARDGLTLLDLASGRRLGAVGGLHPARLLAAGSLSVAALEADGTVTGLVPAGHLSLL
jgi:putative pyrroloquinoline-quinone binding quinoprotein